MLLWILPSLMRMNSCLRMRRICKKNKFILSDVAAQYYRVKGADIIDDARRACEQN